MLLSVWSITQSNYALLVRWDTLVENLLDPSHVPFAHHGMAVSGHLHLAGKGRLLYCLVYVFKDTSSVAIT